MKKRTASPPTKPVEQTNPIIEREKVLQSELASITTQLGIIDANAFFQRQPLYGRLGQIDKELASIQQLKTKPEAPDAR
jgi:hypothetical protein